MTEPLNGLTGLRRELELRWGGHDALHGAHETSHAREHEFAQKAIDIAAIAAAQNKADANEWRSAMADRESRFATKEVTQAILNRLDAIERAALVAAERERQRIADEAEDRRQSERRVTRSQWVIGIVVGLLATFGTILVNLALRSV